MTETTSKQLMHDISYKMSSYATNWLASQLEKNGWQASDEDKSVLKEGVNSYIYNSLISTEGASPQGEGYAVIRKGNITTDKNPDGNTQLGRKLQRQSAKLYRLLKSLHAVDAFNAIEVFSLIVTSQEVVEEKNRLHYNVRKSTLKLSEARGLEPHKVLIMRDSETIYCR